MLTSESYWSKVEARAKELKTDGCSGLVQWYKKFCWEHDIHYRTHKTVDGKPISKWRADARFALRHMQAGPVAGTVGAGRWIGLTFGGWHAWHAEERGTPSWAQPECPPGEPERP